MIISLKVMMYMYSSNFVSVLVEITIVLNCALSFKINNFLPICCKQVIVDSKLTKESYWDEAHANSLINDKVLHNFQHISKQRHN